MAEPRVVAVVGTTGAGKSRVALEIARQCNGEVVNCDVMQMYAGLDVATNKASADERAAVRHHLLSFSTDYTGAELQVHEYRQRAREVVREVASRGKLPVLVGGSNYYMSAVLFDDRLAPRGDAAHDTVAVDADLEAMTAGELMAELERVDRRMAERWHVNDVRRVRRSIMVFRATGRRHSDVIDEQRSAGSASRLHFARTRVIWVDCGDRDRLYARLDARVGEMRTAGIVDEVRAFWRQLRDGGEPYDESRGVLQAIGFKEFRPLLDVDGEPGEDVVEQCLDTLRRNTRKYAASQLTWIRNQWVKTGVLHPHLYRVDGSDESAFADACIAPALAIVRHELPAAACDDAGEAGERAAICATHRVAAPTADAGESGPWRKRKCDVCHKEANGEREWEAHVKSRQHRRLAHKSSKPRRPPGPAKSQDASEGKDTTEQR